MISLIIGVSIRPTYFLLFFVIKEFYKITPSEFAMAPTKVLFTYKENKNA